MKHISSLDGIRGLAVLLVVFFHYQERVGTGVFGVVASTGWAGVDVFLVLSGFLITSILFEQRGTDHFFRNFYIRRALRLFPLYYFILLIIAVCTPIFHIRWHLGQLGFFFYSTNYVLSVHGDYGTMGPFDLFHTWTLSLEEQFYILWPWIVGGLGLSRRALIRVCVGGIVLAPVIRFVLLHFQVEPWFIAGSLPTRMDSLLIGAALALIPMPSLRTARVVALVAVLPLPLVVWKAHSLFFLAAPWQGIGFSCVGFLAAAVLVLSMYPATLLHRVANWEFLRFYGRYSYGIYLWHYLFSEQFFAFRVWMLGLSPHRIPMSLAAFLLILAASTGIAVVSYRWLEAPFLRLKHRFER